MSLLAYVFDLYQAELARSNSVDFDDLLSLTVALLQQHPEVCAGGCACMCLGACTRRWALATQAMQVGGGGVMELEGQLRPHSFQHPSRMQREALLVS